MDGERASTSESVADVMPASSEGEVDEGVDKVRLSSLQSSRDERRYTLSILRQSGHPVGKRRIVVYSRGESGWLWAFECMEAAAGQDSCESEVLRGRADEGDGEERASLTGRGSRSWPRCEGEQEASAVGVRMCGCAGVRSCVARLLAFKIESGPRNPSKIQSVTKQAKGEGGCRVERARASSP
ncbi:hypothetical protein L1887_48078 [Cichorium endivia]|nr:hypothetical protein L1887_48078 [Cichorium endivia]